MYVYVSLYVEAVNCLSCTSLQTCRLFTKLNNKTSPMHSPDFNMKAFGVKYLLAARK